jgi:hypothetical protein
MTSHIDNQDKNLETLLALLRRLDGDYGKIQAEVDALAKDRIAAGKNLAYVIVEMSQRSEELRATHQSLMDELNGALRELCEMYLRAQENLRARIRDAFTGQRMLLVHLINLAGTACLSIPQGNASYWLRMALAAVSIEDNRTDFRDTIVALQYLYSAAAKAGLEPKPYFDEVAAVSSDAMREFLSGFARRYP